MSMRKIWGVIATSLVAVAMLICHPANGQLTQTEVHKLLAGDGESSDHFGISVAIQGDTALVGAKFDGDKGFQSGSVYVYKFDGVAWIQVQKLTASDGAAGDNFGWSVAIDGGVAIIGAVGGRGSVDDSGAVYVYTFDSVSETWTETQKLTASDSQFRGLFGFSVGIDGATAIVGATKASNNGQSSGAAYVYALDVAGWHQTKKLIASDGAAADNFGWSVAIDGNTAIVGATGASGIGPSSGAAYVYTLDATGWSETTKLFASDGSDDDMFGISVAIDGGTAMVGAYWSDYGAVSNAGAAYVYTRNGAVWTEMQILTANDRAPHDLFGVSIAVDGGTAIIGATRGTGGVASSGAAYVYSFDSVAIQWKETSKLIGSDGVAFDIFGEANAIDGNMVIVGAPGGDGHVTDAGAAYIFDVTSNQAPIVDGGNDQNVLVGDTVNLTATATDPEGDPITGFTWSLDRLPKGSSAVLIGDLGSATTSFIADFAGVYVLSVTATDGTNTSLPATVVVTAEASPPPVPDIDLSPLELNFGSVPIGEFVDLLTTLSNQGDAILNIVGSPFIVPGSSPDFDVGALQRHSYLPGESEDVGVTYTPSTEGPAIGWVAIRSDDPDEPEVQVKLIGEGVSVALPPAEQVVAIIDFINTAFAAGTLSGTGNGSSPNHRFGALVNMIEASSDLIVSGDFVNACSQLEDALAKTDGMTPPPDFVSGPAAAELAQLIVELRTTLGCMP